MARAQAGDAAALAQLYVSFSDTVYRYIYYRVGGKSAAEDLCSEVFVRAVRRLPTFTWRGRDFGAWLVTIACNLVADHFSSARSRLEVTTGELVDSGEWERSVEDVALDRLRASDVSEALGGAPPPYAVGRVALGPRHLHKRNGTADAHRPQHSPRAPLPGTPAPRCGFRSPCSRDLVRALRLRG